MAEQPETAEAPQTFAEQLRTYDWLRPNDTGYLLTPQEYDSERSLAPVMLSWIEHYCKLPNGQPYVADMDFAHWLNRTYALDENGLPLVSQSFYVRSKGIGKSLSMACIAFIELFGPCRFDGWAEGGEILTGPGGFFHVYEPGEAMARPIDEADIRILATKEEQARRNVLGNLKRFIRENDLDHRVTRRTASVIETDTGKAGVYPSNGAGEDGVPKASCYLLDELHEWRIRGAASLGKLFDVVAQNARKAPSDNFCILMGFTTAWQPGEWTVIENKFETAKEIAEGHALNLVPGMVFDHLKAGEHWDLSKPEELMEALVEAHGGREWIPYRNHVAGMATIGSVATFRRYTLSQPVASENALATEMELDNAEEPPPLMPGEAVTIGADLSTGTKVGNYDGRIKRTPDESVMALCRVSDGAVFIVWHDGISRAELEAQGGSWEPDIDGFLETFDKVMTTYNVLAAWCDESGYVKEFNALAAKYGRRVKAPLSKAKPFSFFFQNASRLTQVVTMFREIISNGQLPIGDGMFPGGKQILRRHLLNSQITSDRGQLNLAKQDGVNGTAKIDAAISAMLAVAAAQDVISKGISLRKRGMLSLKWL